MGLPLAEGLSGEGVEEGGHYLGRSGYGPFWGNENSGLAKAGEYAWESK